MSEFTLEQTALALQGNPFLHAEYVATDTPRGHEAFDALQQIVSNEMSHGVYMTYRAGMLAIKYSQYNLQAGALCSTATGAKPILVLLAAHNADEALIVAGAIQGDRDEPLPFVGYIKTLEAHRKQGHANRLIGCMNVLSHTIYGKPLTSGPKSYLSPDGLKLAEAIQAKYDLTIAPTGEIVGR